MRQGSLKSHIASSPSWTTILKALADENRLQIIGALLKQESSVQNLSTTLDMKIYNISKHLKILEGTGLVEKKKDGIHRIYSITSNLRSRLSRDNQVLDLGCCKFTFGDLEK
ncbi:MAG: ArsR family transcriptional regulator [Nitrospiraceae bacterium]|nr:MAG: ArsR family transcriptional regulator [Nitrospiraceae bacterium]